MKSKMIVFSLIIVMVLGFSYGITNNSNNDNEIVTVISSIYPEYSLDELVKYSDLIVFGEVIDISKPFEIIPAGGGDSSIFTDYKINIDTVIKDEFGGIDNSIILRFQGGRIGNETVEMEDIEDLNIGDKHILFLEKPKTGGGYITDEDYYLLRGGAQGIFDIENGNEETIDLKKEFVSQDGEKRIL